MVDRIGADDHIARRLADKRHRARAESVVADLKGTSATIDRVDARARRFGTGAVYQQRRLPTGWEVAFGGIEVPLDGEADRLRPGRRVDQVDRLTNGDFVGALELNVTARGPENGKGDRGK